MDTVLQLADYLYWISAVLFISVLAVASAWLLVKLAMASYISLREGFESDPRFTSILFVTGLFFSLELVRVLQHKHSLFELAYRYSAGT